MATLQTHGISLYYETLGARTQPPVLLISGLGGTALSWTAQVERFARDHFVILVDQRGTGRTTHTREGHALPQLAADMVSLVQHIDVGPVHVVGSSTGGAIAQHMALEHPSRVRSLTLSSSWARGDAYMKREFAVRRALMAGDDLTLAYAAYAVFLFSPRYTREHAQKVQAWVERCAAQKPERDIALQRIDMIMAHDVLSRLHHIAHPTFVLCGDHDFCTPPQLSEELAHGIAQARLHIMPGGHLIHDEQPDAYYNHVHEFLVSI